MIADFSLFLEPTLLLIQCVVLICLMLLWHAMHCTLNARWR